MIGLPLPRIEERAGAWAAALASFGVRGAAIRPGRSAVGGGSLPGETLPTAVLSLSLVDAPGGEEAVLHRLRRGRPPLIARVAEGHLLLDPRTVSPDDDALVPPLVAGALTGRDG
jgi:L-seryl-tRNA(Ser) seleniumtransferase